MFKLSVSEEKYLKIVRTSAWYDLIVTAPFVTPWTFKIFYSYLSTLASTLKLEGQISVLDPGFVLFGNLLGSVVIVWSIARLRQPTVALGRLDALSRFLFACWQIYSVVNGGTMLVLVFTFFELLFGVFQILQVKKVGTHGD